MNEEFNYPKRVEVDTNSVLITLADGVTQLYYEIEMSYGYPGTEGIPILKEVKNYGKRNCE